MDQCPCMDKSEKYVQPHMLVTAYDEVCQCIDNAYTCVPNKVSELREYEIYFVEKMNQISITLPTFRRRFYLKSLHISTKHLSLSVLSNIKL